MGAMPSPLRTARPGDLCILLEPANLDEVAALQQHQLILQRHYGGQIMEPVHITLQRFNLTHPQQYQALLDELESLRADWRPFKISAQGLFQLHSDYRQADVIKWKILPPEELALFSAQIEHILADIGGASLYPPGWVSTLVTALTGIAPASSPEEPDLHYPQPLFTPGILKVSRIHSPTEFEILEQIPL
jgi:hypothetical protein